ncbi:MAG: prepilin-type N-terminal cleavage/methylation domain-containing protein [Chthonomonadales bacterium]|nr:prepilin-type N-terminal cleavage/methylation domain-containing protein [Chthonomonadales bacterium]
MYRTRRNNGISLIEVLVVIVVLLVGIMSVVRLFPPGFLINRRTEATTLSSRLAKAEVDRYTAGSANLMDAVLPTTIEENANSPTGYYIRVDLDATPDELTEVAQPVAGVDPYYLSGPNKFRWIRGETVRVPNPSPIAPGVRGSVYMLSAAPVYDNLAVDANGAVVDSIVVSGQPLRRRGQDSTDPYGPYLRSLAEYAIDYDNAQIAFFPAPYPRTFKITYSYYDASNEVQTVAAQSLAVPAASQAVWQPVSPPNGGELVRDGDVVSRAFTRVAYPPAWSPDPYEYCVVPSTASIAGFASMGVLIFNPLGRDYVERTARGNVPLTAKIDYNVLDWRILREDRPMPGIAPYQVRLGLKRIMRVGEYEADQSQYPGLWRDPNAPHVDLLVYNVTTGQEVPPSQYSVNYREGVVTFTDAFGGASASGTFRFFYKANGDWAMQVLKAASGYHRAASHTANIGFGEFYLGGGASGGDATRMYFPLMESGNTVNIRDLWYWSHNDITGATTLRRASNETYRINSARGQFWQTGRGPLTWLDLRDNHNTATDRAVAWALSSFSAAPAGVQPTYGIQPALGVQGISFRVRVVWSGSTTVTETASGNVAHRRWRRLNLDTFLTRGEG